MSIYCHRCLQVKETTEMCQSSYMGKTTWECLKRCESAINDAFPRSKRVEFAVTDVTIDDLVKEPMSRQCRDGKVRYVHPVTGEHYYTSVFASNRNGNKDTLYQTSCINDDPRIPMLSLVFGVTFDDLELADKQLPDNNIRYVIKKSGEKIKCSKDNEWSVDSL